MAEFTEVMKHWRRLCRAYSDRETGCKDDCPLMGLSYDGMGCDAIFSDFADRADWDDFEGGIMRWAESHPEPVYPKWEEWLVKMGVLNPVPLWQAWHVSSDNIPADIARKLGIEPVADCNRQEG